MEIIAKITFGSRLFGTETDQSDTDIKAIFLPNAEAISGNDLGVTIHDGTTSLTTKNSRDDIDVDSRDLMKYLQLLESGAPEALEILFAPLEYHLVMPGNAWVELQEQRRDFLHADLIPFDRLIRNNSLIALMGQKESDACKRLIDVLDIAIAEHGKRVRLHQITDKLAACCSPGDEGVIRLEERPDRHGRTEKLLIIGHKATHIAEKVAFARTVAATVLGEAERARGASGLTQKEAKNLSLAVRLSFEMLEFLTSHTITLPRPEKELLTDIKLGKIELGEITSLLHDLGEKIKDAKASTTLPCKPNSSKFKNFLAAQHDMILAGTPRLKV